MADSRGPKSGISLSEHDEALIRQSIGSPIGELIHSWLQTGAEERLLDLPDVLYLDEQTIREMSFTGESPSSVSLRSEYDPFENWDDVQPRSSREYHINRMDRAIQDRLLKLLGLLGNGVILTKAIAGDVPPIVWLRTDAEFLLVNSDLALENGIYESICVSDLGTHDRQATAPKGHAGRPPVYDDDELIRILVEIANSPDGLPRTQAEIVRLIQLQYALRNHGKEPSDSLLKEKLKRWLPATWKEIT